MVFKQNQDTNKSNCPREVSSGPRSTEDWLREDDSENCFLFCDEEEEALQLEEAYYKLYPLCSANSVIRKHKKGRARIFKSRRNKSHQPRKTLVSTSRQHNSTRSDRKKRISKRKLAREEEILAQLQARKENVQDRVKHLIPQMYDYDSYSYTVSSYAYQQPQDYILPAEDLGVDEGSMYDRLLRILEGDDITPEDYELLLQLDNNNARSTLEEKSIDKIPVLIIGEEAEEGKIPVGEIQIDHCEICLEPWSVGTAVRRLPCDHMFCKDCIDYWLKEVSQKCPTLSCYWCEKDDS